VLQGIYKMSAPPLSELTDIEKALLYERAADIARLAPSCYNVQPWRFRVNPKCVEIRVNHASGIPAYQSESPESELDQRERYISCGCALFYLILSLRQEGYHERVTLFPRGETDDIVAQVWAADITRRLNKDDLLFASIMRRRTNRLPFFPRVLPLHLISRLRSAASEEQCEMFPMTGEKRDSLIEILNESAQTREAEETRKREAALRSEAQRLDHIRIAKPLPKLDESIDMLTARTQPINEKYHFVENGARSFDRHQTASADAPLLAVLTSEGDSKRDWMLTGQSLAHVLLLASHENISASFLNDPLLVPHLRKKVANLLQSNEYPQTILALGYSPLNRPTARYNLSELLIAD
jgi:hypothetical protein